MTAILRSVIVAVFGLSLLAQQEPTPPVIIRVPVNIVVVPVTVKDGNGTYVNGLRPQDFRLTDNGQLQDIKVDISYVPISLVVAIQANADTEALLPKIQKIDSLLSQLVVGEQGEIAVLIFDHRIQVLQDFTSDWDKLSQAFKKVNRPGGQSSRMNDAVREAIRMLSQRPPNRRRVILLISETRDKGSESRARQVMLDAQMNNVIIESVNISHWLTTLTRKPDVPRPDPIPPTARPLPAGVPPTPGNVVQVTGGQGTAANFIPVFVEIFRQIKAIFIDNPVEVYTKYTGGQEHFFNTQKGLEQAIARIGEELQNQYIISYNPNNKLESGFHQIQVEVVKDGRLRRDYTIVTRPGYWL